MIKGKNTKIQLLLILLIIILAVGSSYAIFSIGQFGDENKISTGTINMTYKEPTNELNLNATNLTDNEGENQTNYFEFEVSATASGIIEIPYNIYLTESTSNNIPNNNIKIYLTKLVNNKETIVLDTSYISELKSLETKENSKTIIIEKFNFKENKETTQTDTYRLRIWNTNNENTNIVKEQDGQHIVVSSKIYKFTVNVATTEEDVSVKKIGIKKAILGINNNNVVEAETGLNLSNETNNNEPTYYYKGNITNNYVSFANNIWRIVRVNEDGTIRLITETGIDNKTFYVFNPSYSG